MVSATLNLFYRDHLRLVLNFHDVVGKFVHFCDVLEVPNLINSQLTLQVTSEGEKLAAFVLSIFGDDRAELLPSCH